MKVVALSGGVGGARLVDGLARVLSADELTIVVNTGDDFVHWGLQVCPDLDTVMYTLANLSPPEQGWGLQGETFRARDAVARLGGETWFNLGDQDLATHLLRTEALRAGASLSDVTAQFCKRLGVGHRIVPMSDSPRPTWIETADGRTLPFQQWLVRERAPLVKRVWSEGATEPAPEVLPAILNADLIVIGPSNPYVSIEPILGLHGVRAALSGKRVVAVSPILGGVAVKGPLAEMIPALEGEAPSAAAVAKRYRGCITGYVVESGDSGPVDMPVLATSTWMKSVDDRVRLATEVLEWGGRFV